MTDKESSNLISFVESIAKPRKKSYSNLEKVLKRRKSEVLASFELMPTHARKQVFAPENAACASLYPLEAHLSLCTVITFGDKIMIRNDCL